MNASVATVTSPSSGGTVKPYFDAATWIYGASASANIGYSVTDWTLYCKYCHSVIARFGAVSNIGFDLHNYPGHPGPFVVTCYFSGGNNPGGDPYVTAIEVNLRHASIEDGRLLDETETFTKNVSGGSPVSIALTAPESIVVENHGRLDGTWHFVNYGIASTYRCSIVSREGFNTNNATIVVAPGRSSHFGYGELSVEMFYYRTPYLLRPGDGIIESDGSNVRDNRLVIHQSGVLVHGTDFKHKVVDTHGDSVPF